ncbi:MULTISPECIES: DUF3221 domain-containing protein [Bacillus]|uniref:DUF3221 domain-containing protein n=1 Tax=Bacillus TaxID=1386 RepID=UPI002DBF055B|nr:DUF3221 domain-containing protein [Bacillus halotolerans]MEC1607326.1 DUF3221 domain-containing protein [Bacillus halotolerans]
MRKIGISVLAFFAFISGCNDKEENKIKTPKMQNLVGFILFKDEKSAVFLEGKHAPEKEDFKLSQDRLIRKYRNHVVILELSQIENKEDLVEGKKMKVWLNTLKESDPPKATIKKFNWL